MKSKQTTYLLFSSEKKGCFLTRKVLKNNLIIKIMDCMEMKNDVNQFLIDHQPVYIQK